MSLLASDSACSLLGSLEALGDVTLAEVSSLVAGGPTVRADCSVG